MSKQMSLVISQQASICSYQYKTLSLRLLEIIELPFYVAKLYGSAQGLLNLSALVEGGGSRVKAQGPKIISNS